ncbi:MAG TPA: ABC transporter permease [Candidatus Cybelea sp.]|jgi:predicted permease|nr:ABC transporter permease [Candidatus Cybelea sp.]
METFRQDLRYAFRMLLKAPGFTLIAMLALGLGIGANTAIFSVFNGILWRPLPVKDSQQLVILASKPRAIDFPLQLSYPDFKDYRELKTVFSDLAAYVPNPVNFGAEGRPERAWAEMVSGNYFSMLGLEAARGRTFASDEGWIPGKDPLMVLSYKYWQKRFGGSPAIIGRTVQVNNHAFTIIGVAPESWRGAYYFLEPDFYLPLTALGTLDPAQADTLDRRTATFLRVLGRLQPGVTAAQAMAAAEPLDRRLAQEFPEAHNSTSLLVLPELKARPEPGLTNFMSAAALVFMLLVGLVLLIACANVANLILARANGRRKEFATRTALGATRGRMMRQLLTETVLLSAFGGILGLVFARWAALALMSVHIPTDIPLRLFDLRMDWRIFGFSFFAALITGMIAGLLPSIEASRTDLADTLKAGGRSGGASTGHHRFRNALVVAQVAVCLLLLACAGFFMRSLQNSAQVDMGFRADHTLMMTMDLGLQGYNEERGQQFYKQLSERVRSLPGVRDAAIGGYIPMGYDSSLLNIFPEGQVVDDKTKTESAFDDEVQPDYFRTAGTPVIQGREFTEADSASGPKVAIVNEAFAKKIWPGENPVGKSFRTKKDGPTIQVVGVTRTGKYLFLYETPQLFVYLPLAQSYLSGANLFVYTESDPQQLVAAVREQISQLDASLPVFGVTTMDAHVKYGKPLLPARLSAMLVGAFGLLGLVLASVGVYGVVSYSVSQRTQEIGIRTALGAQRSNVLAMVLKQGMSMALIGTAVGIVLSFLLFRGLSSVLYGVKSTDFVTLGAVSAILLAVAFAASYVPALRATRVDPVVALREQ